MQHNTEKHSGNHCCRGK